MEITVILIIWRNGAVSYASTTVVCSCQVKYFIDHFKATGHYKRNNTNNCNKIANTALYQNKTKSTWWILNSSECETYIFTQKPDGLIIGHLFYSTSSTVHHFKAINEFKLELQYGNAQFPVKIGYLFCVTLKFGGWPWESIGHLSYSTSIFEHHFKEFKLEWRSRNAQFGSKSVNFWPRDLEIWRMTLINNRGTLPYHIKHCASFQSHRWIQTGVTVRKRPIEVEIRDFLSRVTLKFDWWPWKTIGHLFYATSSFVHHFIANWSYSPETHFV